MKKRITIALLFVCFWGGLQAQSAPDIADMLKKMEEMQKQLLKNFDDTDLAEKGFKLDTSFFFKMDTTLSDPDFFNFSNPFGGQGIPNNMNEMFDAFGDISQLFKQFGFPGMEGEDNTPKDDGALRENNEDELLPEEKLRLSEEKQNNADSPAPAPEKTKKAPNKRKTTKL